MATKSPEATAGSVILGNDLDTLNLPPLILESPDDVLPGEVRTLTYEDVPLGKFRGQESVRIAIPYEIATSRSSIRSPRYVATQRRRAANRLATQLAAFSGKAAVSEFAVVTAPFVEAIHNALDLLAGVPTEGNSRECLRMIRECFLNGGWNRFKEDQNRKVIQIALSILADEEDVQPEHVDQVFNALEDAGLEVLELPTWELAVTNGETQISY